MLSRKISCRAKNRHDSVSRKITHLFIHPQQRQQQQQQNLLGLNIACYLIVTSICIQNSQFVQITDQLDRQQQTPVPSVTFSCTRSIMNPQPTATSGTIYDGPPCICLCGSSLVRVSFLRTVPSTTIHPRTFPECMIPQRMPIRPSIYLFGFC